jgi:hypothetical protein
MVKLFDVESPSAQFSVTGALATKSSPAVAVSPVTVASTLTAPSEPPVRFTVIVMSAVPLAGSVCEYVAESKATMPGPGINTIIRL